eukprot:7504041-Pyramimonas_sp.AAC.1
MDARGVNVDARGVNVDGGGVNVDGRGGCLGLPVSSGAGKTTLLDVLAGRKTVGTMEGDILLGSSKPTRNQLRHEVDPSAVHIDPSTVHIDTSTVHI